MALTEMSLSGPGQERPSPASVGTGEQFGRQDHLRDAIRLLLFTGARLQEVLKAEWGQFDLETGLWEKPSAHTKKTTTPA
jgi:integrase